MQKMSLRYPQWMLRNWVLNVTALVAGGLLPFAFAPYEIRSFAILSPMFLFFVWGNSVPRTAAIRGFLFGIGLFGLGTHWIYYSLHLFGDAIAPLAFIITVGFVAFFALYIAALGWLIVRFFPKGDSDFDRWIWAALVLPAAWTLCELFRGWFLTGFPWLSLGYSQINGWLSGYAPILGVYGVGWMIVTTGGLALIVLEGKQYHRIIALGLATAIWLIGFSLGKVEWSEPHGKPIKVRIVQGNIEQHQKFMADMLTPSLEIYKRLSQTSEQVDLIVWPESAIPTFFYKIEDYLSDFTKQKSREGTQVLTGGFVYNSENGKYHNSMRMLNDVEAYYHKQHLVPFGEFMPFRSLLSFLSQFIVIPMADLSPGNDTHGRISVKGQLIATSICYEDAFGEELIKQLPEANLLLNMSNDSWFGDSSAPYQHLEIARMRALETSRPMVRVTNTGVSAVIDHQSHLKLILQKSKALANNAMIQPRRGSTVYIKFGNLWVLLGTVCFIVTAIIVKSVGVQGRKSISGCN